MSSFFKLNVRKERRDNTGTIYYFRSWEFDNTTEDGVEANPNINFEINERKDKVAENFVGIWYIKVFDGTRWYRSYDMTLNNNFVDIYAMFNYSDTFSGILEGEIFFIVKAK